MGTMRYQIAMIESEEGVSVWVPALPGCVSQGATEEEAFENIRDALREYLAVVMERVGTARLREVEVAV